MLTRFAAAALIIMAGLCGLSPVDGQILIGRVRNAATGEPITGVSLMIKETTRGTATGADGLFSLSLSDVPAVLVVSHLSYKTLEITFTSFPEGRIDISLEPETHSLGEVEITTRKPEKMMSGKPWEIIDFEFLRDNIIVLANMNGSMFQPCLILADMRGDTLACLDVMKADELYRDFEGNVYLITAQSAYKVVLDSLKLSLEYTEDRADFFATYPVVVDVKLPNWILRNYAYNGQVLDYYLYNETDSSYFVFRSVADEEALDRSYWGPYFDGTEADAHFAKVIINKPIYAPLFRSGDELIVFNYLDNSIEFFDGQAQLSRKVSAPFMQDKGCKENILKDDSTGMFYVTYERNGITSLYLIGLVSGEAEWVCDIPGFVFIEDLKVHGGEAYFLYREKNLSEQQRLFRLRM